MEATLKYLKCESVDMARPPAAAKMGTRSVLGRKVTPDSRGVLDAQRWNCDRGEGVRIRSFLSARLGM